jgi:hypothetical protein
MTSSTSSNRVLVAIATLLLLCGVASAGRKRIVVLDFSGPKAEKFHDDVVKLLKKSHTVISTDKWNGAADELDAGKVTEKNVKKVAKKLKVDGVVEGKIEKRRDEYIIRIKLRAGTNGEVVGNSIDTKADGPRLDGQASSDLKDELVGQIDELEANHGGGGDDDEADKPSKKKKHGDDEASDDDDSGSSKASSKKKKKASDDDEASDDDSGSKHSAFSKKSGEMKGGDKVDDDDKPAKKSKKDKDKSDDEDADTKPAKKSKKDKDKSDDDDTKAALSTKHDDDESPLPKETKKKKKSSDDDDSSDDDHPKKKVAHKDDDDEDGGSVSASSDDDAGDKADGLTPARRAIDVTAGLSFTGRNLGFVYKSTLAQPPPGYKQAIPVAGAVFDATFYPLAFNKKNHELTSGIGLEISYDKAIKINSQKLYNDQATGAQKVADLTTAESKLEVAAVFRYPLNKTPMAPVVGGKLAYEQKLFSIQQALPANADPSQSVDVPNVTYTIISPQAFIIYPASPKLTLHALVGFDAVTNTGDIQKPTQYGAASVLAVEANAGADYNLTPNIFVRALAGIQTMGYTFKGDPMSKTNTRDNDPTTQDVTGARDTYFGGSVTLGYAY